MLQLISYYRMPEDREEEIIELVQKAGLNGVENLIYGSTPADKPFAHVTKGVHLRYWTCWVDFWQGNKARIMESFPDDERISACYGAVTREGWLSTIRKNILAALAEKPAYLVWHVQDCTIEETWTGNFHHTDYEVLAATAEVYRECKDLIPDGVKVLFENIFWPGLCYLEPEKVDFFFRKLDDELHTGIMFDTGHFMNTNPRLKTEAEGADYICQAIERLGSLKGLIRGIHLNCSLSGEYQKNFKREMPPHCTDEVILRHICNIDRHRPFETMAAAQVVECIAPEYLTHELFAEDFKSSIQMAKIQMALLEKLKQ